MKMKWKLLYDGKEIANIATNKSLTLEECFYFAGIDIDEMIDATDPRWDIELFEMA